MRSSWRSIAAKSLSVARVHKGHVKIRITLHGLSAHSGYPHLGKNAIEPAGRVIGALAGAGLRLSGDDGRYKGKVAIAPFVELHPLDDINHVFHAVHAREITRRAILVP